MSAARGDRIRASTLRTLAIALSLLLFAGACCSTTICYGPSRPTCIPGWWLLAFGWWPAFVRPWWLAFAWWASPASAYLVVLSRVDPNDTLRGRRRVASVVAVAALAIGVVFAARLGAVEIYFGNLVNGTFVPAISLGPGYYLWLVGIVVALAASTRPPFPSARAFG